MRVVTLDDLLLHPEQPKVDCVVDFETKALRDARDRMVAEGLAGGYAYADKVPHPRIWKLLAHVRSVDQFVDGITTTSF